MHRPRRLRQTKALRALVAETSLNRSDLVLPLFVREGIDTPSPIESMPGVVQHTMGTLPKAVAQAAEAGLSGVMLFGVPATRDACGSAGDADSGILNLALQQVKAEVGDDMVVMADTCIDEFTDHGHCGVLDEDGNVDNDATLERYTKVAIAQARAGADVVGLSGMMDGQVAAVRHGLDGQGLHDTVLLAYAAKYASALYGPFREAVDSQLTGDRTTYQQDPANRRESVREVQMDIEQGADIVMVKPASFYLDIISDTAELSSVPVWAYQVSGEYAMIEAAAEKGWVSREKAIVESLLSIKRAGAEAILTYYAAEVADMLA